MGDAEVLDVEMLTATDNRAKPHTDPLTWTHPHAGAARTQGVWGGVGVGGGGRPRILRTLKFTRFGALKMLY